MFLPVQKISYYRTIEAGEKPIFLTKIFFKPLTNINKGVLDFKYRTTNQERRIKE